MIDAMAGFDPEDLDTREGLGRYPQATWAGQLTAPDLKKFRIGVLREAMSTLPANIEVQTVFDARARRHAQSRSASFRSVVSGIDLARQSDSSSIGVWPYEVIVAGDVYLKRLGPKRPFKTMKEMITTVGPEKFVDSYVLALSYPPLDEDPGFLRRYRGRQAIRDLIESLLARTILTRLLSSMVRRRRLRKTFWCRGARRWTRLARASRRRHCLFEWPPRHRHACGLYEGQPAGWESSSSENHSMTCGYCKWLTVTNRQRRSDGLRRSRRRCPARSSTTEIGNNHRSPRSGSRAQRGLFS